MNSKIIIIAILILVKVVGVASRVKAENYIPGYTCGDAVKTWFYFNNSYSDLIYRCGNRKIYEDV